MTVAGETLRQRADRFREEMHRAAIVQKSRLDQVSVWALVGPAIWTQVRESMGCLVEFASDGKTWYNGIRTEVTGEPYFFQIVIRDKHTGKCKVVD